jgi:hypothetical protein
MVLRSNVEIRCGLDGSVHNNCALVGGFLQLLMQVELIPEWGLTTFVNTTTYTTTNTTTTTSSSEYDQYFLANNQNDNVTIRGLTFTGNLIVDTVFGGCSISISNPSQNFRMVDCLWENITSSNGLIHLGTNPFQRLSGYDELPPRVVDFTLERCTFRNVIYDGRFAFANNQNLTMIGVQFENIQLSPFVQPCVDRRVDWCHGLVYCLDVSVCTLSDICVRGLEYFGSGAVLMATNESLITLSGSFSFRGLELPLVLLQEALSLNATNGITGPGPGPCASGMSRLALNYATHECLEEGDYGSWRNTSTCPL